MVYIMSLAIVGICLRGKNRGELVRYTVIKYCSYEVTQIITRYLHSTDMMGEDDTISTTVVFPDGMEMDVKLCGARDDYPWTEAVLFNHGSEVCCTEVYDEFFGVWELSDDDNEYVVILKTQLPVGTRVTVYDNFAWGKSGVITQVGYDGHDDLYVIDLDDGGDIIVMDDEFEVER